MGASSSLCGDLVGGFCGAGVDSGGLDRSLFLWCWMHLAMGESFDVYIFMSTSTVSALVFPFSMACLFLCNDKHNS